MTTMRKVMCDAYTPAGEPIPTNKRHTAAKIFSHPDVLAEEPWYGIEPEYTLWEASLDLRGLTTVVLELTAFGRDIVDVHYKACLYAGINISGINGEVMLAQWEFQVGPAVGISAGDALWVVRYILEEGVFFIDWLPEDIEIAGFVVSFDPKLSHNTQG